MFQVKHHEDLINFLEDPNVMIARQAISKILYGFDRNKANSMVYLKLEEAYNLAQKNGCKLAGWELRLVLYHEVAMITKLYAKRNSS